MNKDKIKIYCKFNKTKPPIDKVICKMFSDFAQKENNKDFTHMHNQKLCEATQEPCRIHNKNIEKRTDKI